MAAALRSIGRIRAGDLIGAVASVIPSAASRRDAELPLCPDSSTPLSADMGHYPFRAVYSGNSLLT